MNISIFKEELTKLGINVTDDILDKFTIYKEFLIEYNKHTNLTSITDDSEIYLKHFYDSATIITSIDLNSINNLVDIGSGAGFPGVVIKLLFPHIHVILIDSNNKKTKFLEELINRLNLTDIEVLTTRVEDFAKNNIDKYDCVTSRAVANLYTLSELALPLVKVNGYFIPLKGNIEDEKNEAEKHIKELNGSIESINSFNLPIENSIRNIIKIKKIGKNPQGYPRSYNIIKKCHERNINK